MRECVFLFNLDAIVQDKNSKKNSSILEFINDNAQHCYFKQDCIDENWKKMVVAIGNSESDIAMMEKADIRIGYGGINEVMPEILSTVDYAIYEEKNFLYLGQNNLYLDELIKKVKEFNVNIKYDKKSVRIDLPKNGKTYSHHMVFGHYPDLCTDWQPLLTILCIDSEEETFIYDKVFNDRYRYLAQLKQIYPGLEIEIFRNLAILKNMDKDQRNEYLNMQEFPLLDIRAAAVVIIGLSKCAEFYLSNVTQLLRGYENLFQISEYMGENGEYEFRR